MAYFSSTITECTSVVVLRVQFTNAPFCLCAREDFSWMFVNKRFFALVALFAHLIVDSHLKIFIEKTQLRALTAE